jgi:hypothetical protein
MKDMAKGKIISFTALLVVLLVSCKFLSEETLDDLEKDDFYAQNMTNGIFYKVKADMLCVGVRCVVWAERGSGVTQKQAQDIANEYDTKIRSKVVDAFSRKDVYTTNNGIRYDFGDMVDYANWLAGRDDRKLTILLLDIKDGFKDPKTDSYIAGYFFGGDFQPQGNIFGTRQYSNGRDMIYIDTHPGFSSPGMITTAYATFAHELQHLINYVTSRAYRKSSYMDTWIDEGLSSQAEHLYLGENLRQKCEWFSVDPAGTIAKGNNFFVWGNHQDDKLAIMDDYASVYLFFRWLYLQADTDLRPHIFYDISNSDFRNYQAVTNVAREINSKWEDWGPLLRTWLAANYYPKNAVYGYKGDDYLKGIVKVKAITGSTVSLYPGEGVYSTMNNSVSITEEVDANIRYAGLNSNIISGTIGTSSPYSGNILLTFNANTNNGTATKPETGVLTGVSPATPSRMAGEDGQTERITGPYVLDARDALGRNSW